jgi:hypothetical protein
MLRDRLIRPISQRGRVGHLVFGALLPVVFLIVDPAVFRGNALPLGGAYLGAFRAFGHVATVTAALLLLRAAISSGFTRIEAGMLYGAAIVAFALGLVLLPVSLLGAFLFGLGLLGLTPFAASWIYLRNAAKRHAFPTGQLLSPPAVAGIVLFVIVPLSAQITTDGIVRRNVESVDRQQSKDVLQAMRWIYDADGLVQQYQSSKSFEERRRLALAHQVMGGGDIERRIAALND